MKENTASLDLVLDEALVADYLAENPDFFLRHPGLLTRLRLGHPERGTVSLVERQLELARGRSAQLEEEITALMAVAAHNEQVARGCHKLTLALVQAQDLAALQQTLEDGMGRHLQLPLSRLWLERELAETQLKTLAKVRARLQEGPYFGRLSENERRALLGARHDQAQSLAVLPLRHQGRELGLWVVASSDPGHFQPDMDALLISQLCNILALRIAALHGRPD
ncbi:DUF484 family protein [Gallaecimonas sp. GXIMD4217]|uniref:DUF484 family protein n=1 Tax=Gallaecimonas sp. GXIMD4217 TaxID=3131927 RepID=UPI00311AC443